MANPTAAITKLNPPIKPICGHIIDLNCVISVQITFTYYWIFFFSTYMMWTIKLVLWDDLDLVVSSSFVSSLLLNSTYVENPYRIHKRSEVVLHWDIWLPYEGAYYLSLKTNQQFIYIGLKYAMYFVWDYDENRNEVKFDSLDNALGLGLMLWCSTSISTIFQLYPGGQLHWLRKPEYPEKTNDLRKSLTKFIT